MRATRPPISVSLILRILRSAFLHATPPCTDVITQSLEQTSAVRRSRHLYLQCYKLTSNAATPCACNYGTRQPAPQRDAPPPRTTFRPARNWHYTGCAISRLTLVRHLNACLSSDLWPTLYSRDSNSANIFMAKRLPLHVALKPTSDKCVRPDTVDGSRYFIDSIYLCRNENVL
jgi:hypothetical protein